MQDYKARRSAQRRPFRRMGFPLRFGAPRSNAAVPTHWSFGGRLFSGGRSALMGRRRSQLPKGFQPLASPPSPPAPPSGWPAASAPIGRWFAHPPLLRLLYAGVVVWLLTGAGMRAIELWQARLERVRVSGTAAVSSAQVIRTAGLIAGTRLVDVDPYAITLRLRQDPRIEAADARRVFPHTLWIDVRERVPELRVLLNDGRAAVVDRFNAVIRTEAAAPADLPLVRGVPEANGSGAAHPGSILGGAGGSLALTQTRLFLAQAKMAGLPQVARGTLDLSEIGTVTVTPPDPGGGRSVRLIFPLDRAGTALDVYRRLIQSPAGTALASAREADLRFVDAAEGGRVILRP